MMRMTRQLWFSYWSITFAIISSAGAGSDNRKLLQDLFTKYDIRERPVKDENDTVVVQLGLTLMGLNNLNTVEEYLEANIWLTMEWNDANLKWNSSNYGGIKSLSIDAQNVWRPDILVYNSVHPEFDSVYHTNVVLKEDGNITFINPGIFRTSCKVDATWYPFDIQKCSLKFGSWTWNGNKVDLQLQHGMESGDVSSFVKDETWELLGVPARRNEIYYSCCPEAYVDISFMIELKRHGEPLFATYSFMLLLASAITMLSLFLPTNSGQRLNLGVLSLLGLLIMNGSISMSLGGKISFIVSYFATLGLMTFATIFCNVFILYFYNRNPALHKMPKWIHFIFCEQLPRLIFLNRPKKIIDYRLGPISTHSGTGFGNGTDSYEQHAELTTTTDMQHLLQRLSGQETQPINDWQFFATVLDRLVLIIYIISALTFFVSLYSRFP